MILAVALVAASCSLAASGAGRGAQTLAIRGQVQTLHTYGARGGVPVVVSSGDGGWIHLGPHIAEMLEAHGFFVVGFDVRGYLSGFTSAQSVLRPEDVPGDYRVLLDFAATGGATKPVLIGVSEGAGLSILAAADSRIHAAAAGVIGIGLPPTNELGWRWRDAVIYLTHGVPREPTFSTAPVIAKVSPLPLAAIHSTHDEFVSRDEAERVLAYAEYPKKLWIVTASDHRFSDNLGEFDARLLEALAWVRQQGVR
jgi:pimeloyl-ACP methyl ester carboxylesterase